MVLPHNAYGNSINFNYEPIKLQMMKYFMSKLKDSLYEPFENSVLARPAWRTSSIMKLKNFQNFFWKKQKRPTTTRSTCTMFTISPSSMLFGELFQVIVIYLNEFQCEFDIFILRKKYIIIYLKIFELLLC